MSSKKKAAPAAKVAKPASARQAILALFASKPRQKFSVADVREHIESLKFTAPAQQTLFALRSAELVTYERDEVNGVRYSHKAKVKAAKAA